jgi:ArsR family transcriptional regulator
LEEAAATAELLRALADPTRVRIVNVLAIVDQPVCASNLCEPLGLAQPPVSHHVKELMATTANELREEVRRR